MDWAAPPDGKEWIKRLFSLRAVLFVLLLASVFISEMRFDWLEQSIGAYLASTNSQRPESGTIWESGVKARTALKTLEKIVTDKESFRREARKAEHLGQLAASLSVDQGVMLSSDHFRRIFLKLPREEAARIISSYELLKLINEGHWSRSYIKKETGGLDVFFLDEENRVLRQVKIDNELIESIERNRVEINATLDSLPEFANRIYPAGDFFEALASLPEDVRTNALPLPEKLLNVTGRIVRVGISDEIFSGTIELGFEIERADSIRVRVIRGHDWAVWQLRERLEGKLYEPLNRPEGQEEGFRPDWEKDLS